MILSFQNRFEEPIIKGIKIHTFRIDAHDRWKVGMPIQFYVNARTKQMRKFRMDGECRGIQRLIVDFTNRSFTLDATGNWMWLKQLDPLTFCRNDGFTSEEDFWSCIAEIHPNKETIEGKIIHWTDFKY